VARPKGLHEHAIKAQFRRVTELRDADGHVRMTIDGLGAIGGEQAIPPRHVEAEVAVCFLTPDRVVDTTVFACIQQQLKHIPNIGSTRRIGKHRCFQVFGRQAMSYREAEKIDDLFCMRPDEMSTQDAVGVLFNQRLETVDRFIEPASGVPVGSFL
jgi:hypothetical protein